MKRPAVGYIRVSTARQAGEGVSLDAQREKIIAHCKMHDLDLIEIFADEGLSGKRTDNRPGLQKAVAMACKKKAVLVAYSISRLARSTRDCLETHSRLSKYGADLHHQRAGGHHDHHGSVRVSADGVAGGTGKRADQRTHLHGIGV